MVSAACLKWFEPVRKLVMSSLCSRRTDAIKHMVNYYNLPVLTTKYYLEAMDLYRERYKHALFLLFSDDLGWVQQELLPKMSRMNVPGYIGGELRYLKAL